MHPVHTPIERRQQRADNLIRLPALAFGTVNDKLVLVKRGVGGVFPVPETAYGRDETAAALNLRMGVSAAQAGAMMIGASFGWDAPGANPQWWGE
ncbi:MAG: hypothetical protein V4641_05770 [Pseudomonadota bacterium]